MKSRVLVASVLLTTSACAMSLKPEFTAIGAVGAGPEPEPIVTKLDKVVVFYASAPQGFTLRDNELTVEPGFQHRIVGVLRARAGSGGACNVVQRDAIAALQRGAYANGANAVVYATSPLAKERDEAACKRAADSADFGSGWAVVLADAPAPTATAAPAAQ